MNPCRVGWAGSDELLYLIEAGEVVPRLRRIFAERLHEFLPAREDSPRFFKSLRRPNRLNDPAVLSRFVALHESGFLHEPPPFAARHVNHHSNPVHHASAGDFPGKLTAALHGATGDPG